MLNEVMDLDLLRAILLWHNEKIEHRSNDDEYGIPHRGLDHIKEIRSFDRDDIQYTRQGDLLVWEYDCYGETKRDYVKLEGFMFNDRKFLIGTHTPFKQFASDEILFINEMEG